MFRTHFKQTIHASACTIAAVGLALAAALTLAAGAAAAGGEYAIFKDCPIANTELVTCFYNETKEGEVKIGSTAVPIKNPIILQGGWTQNAAGETIFMGAEDGNTLSKSPQTVPGGLLGVVAPESLPSLIRETFEEIVSKGATGVTATTELVAKPTVNFINVLEEEGTGVILPVRVKLSNVFLGNECYIGSASDPLTLSLTTGTTKPPAPNTPIKGRLGQTEQRNEGKLTLIKGQTLVDNAFAAPEVSGCGELLSLLVDPAVDFKLGLPSPAGKNTAILIGNTDLAEAQAVRES